MLSTDQIEFQGESPEFLNLLSIIAGYYSFNELSRILTDELEISCDILNFCQNNNKMLEVALKLGHISSKNLDKLACIFPEAIEKISMYSMGIFIDKKFDNKNFDKKWREFLFSLSERIGDDWKKHYLSNDYQGDRDPFDFVIHCEKMGKIVENDKNSIYNFLEDIKREDLFSFTNEYFLIVENSYDLLSIKETNFVKYLSKTESEKWIHFLHNLSDLLKMEDWKKYVKRYIFIHDLKVESQYFDIPIEFLFFCEKIGHIIRYNKQSIQLLLKELFREDLIDYVEQYFGNDKIQKNREEEFKNCIICFEKEKKFAAINCGHMLCCETCLTKTRKLDACPICEGYICDVLEIFQ